MRKRYSASEKAQIVLEALKEEKPIAQIAAEHKVHPNPYFQFYNYERPH